MAAIALVFFEWRVDRLKIIDYLQELVALANRQARILVLVGTLKTSDEVLLAEDIAARLGGAVFADITSGLRQRPRTVHFSDQLMNSELLSGELLQLDAIVHLGGPLTSARHNSVAKAGAPLYVRVATAPVRMDQDHVVTHHLPCCLAALSEALAEASLEPKSPSSFWKRLSVAASGSIDRCLSGSFSEPVVAQTVSRLLTPSGRLLISSSMPIRDLDFFSKPYTDFWQAPVQPPMANRGASGIDGVISTAAGICAASKVPCTLVIGDVATLQDLNAFQLLGTEAPALTVVLINNGGGGIFSFLPISKHKDVMSPFFNEPHEVDFQSVCNAFNVPHVLCTSLQDFEAAYVTSQSQGGGSVIENVALHKLIGKEVALTVRKELVSQVRLSWRFSAGEDPARPVLVLLHGWMGEKADWWPVSHILEEQHLGFLAIDLPGHGETQVPDGSWEEAAFYNMPMIVEASESLCCGTDSIPAALWLSEKRYLESRGRVKHHGPAPSGWSKQRPFNLHLLHLVLLVRGFCAGALPSLVLFALVYMKDACALFDFAAFVAAFVADVPSQVLDLPPDADKQKIRRRFRKLVATQHPDRRPNDPDAVVKFMRIKKAYEQLMGSDSSLKELKQWAEENREWSESAREFLGEEEDLPPPDVPPALYAGLGVLFVALACGTYFAIDLAQSCCPVQAIKEVLDHLQLQKVVMVGYSLGGRVAMGFADSLPERCAALVVLSANPGVTTAAERHQRWQQDEPKQLVENGLEAFLETWYSAPLWAGLRERRPDVYSRMIAKRQRSQRHLAARALLGLSLARQPNFRPRLGQRLPFWYVYGEMDTKFAEIGKDLAACSSQVSALPCGHAVVEECPTEVASLLSSVLKQLPRAAPEALELEITASWTEPVQLLLKAPLLLSRGDFMPHRLGCLLVLEAKNGDGEIAGLGEVTPLPLFHKETLEEAETQLKSILQRWASTHPKVPFALSRLDGHLTSWLNDHCGGKALLPSVRAGLEMVRNSEPLRRTDEECVYALESGSFLHQNR
eukprot:g26122.t1